MLAVVSVLRAKLTMENDASASTNRNRYQCVWRGSPRVLDRLPVASEAGDGVVIAAATCIRRASSGGLGNETAPADIGLDEAGSGTTCAGAGSRTVSSAARVAGSAAAGPVKTSVVAAGAGAPASPGLADAAVARALVGVVRGGAVSAGAAVAAGVAVAEGTATAATGATTASLAAPRVAAFAAVAFPLGVAGFAGLGAVALTAVGVGFVATGFREVAAADLGTARLTRGVLVGTALTAAAAATGRAAAGREV
jgi:hypothetical protein